MHVEAAGSGALVEHAADVTIKALMEGFAAMEAERDTHSVEAPVLGFDDLFSLAGFVASAPLMGTSHDIDAEENAVPDVEEEEPGEKDGESDDDEPPDEQERVHGYFGAASGRATKESKPVVPQGARNKDSTASGQNNGKGNGKGKRKERKETTASGQTPKVQKTNLKQGGRGSDTLRIDGRGETNKYTTKTNTNPHKQQQQQQTTTTTNIRNTKTNNKQQRDNKTPETKNTKTTTATTTTNTNKFTRTKQIR